MTAWQYAQLAITRDVRTGDVQAIMWRGPGQGLGENFTDSGHSVLELLNRVGADGWELADRQEPRNAEMGRATGIPARP
jgi:hypothetical protein